MFEKLFLKARNEFRKVNLKIHSWLNRKKENLPKKIKYFDGSLYDAVFRSADKYPYNTAIEYSDNQITYKQLIKRINKCAKSLRALGVQKGDKVTICMPNTPEEVSMFYAINEVGAVANMIHPLSSSKDIEYYLNKSKSKVMLCIDVTYSKVKEIIDNTCLEKVIISSATKSMERLTSFVYWLFKGRKIGVKEDEKVLLWNHFISLGSKFLDDPYVKVESTDPAVILYSGGTTGKPKGVVISNRSFNAQALQSQYVSDVLIPENAFLTFLPNFHAFGIGICTHTPLYCGMRAVLIPKFDSRKIKSYLRKYKFNVLCGVPTFYDYMTKLKFRKNELKILKLVVCGGDAMSLQLKQKVNAFLKKYGCETEVRVGYGLTESSGVISLSPCGITDSADVIGYPFPDCEFKIMNVETGKEVNIGDDGEICITGPNLMLEYLEEIFETSQTLITGKDHKLWLHTGDIGFIDSKGLLHYKSRLKRMIITNGYNVYPSHVEEILMQHEAVSSCAVVGIKNETRGEIVKAFIVLKPEKDNILVKSSIQKYLKDNLSKFELPREYKFLDELPKTMLGKIAYKELEKMK